MGYLAPFSSLVGVSLIWDGLFVTTCEIEVLEYVLLHFCKKSILIEVELFQVFGDSNLQSYFYQLYSTGGEKGYFLLRGIGLIDKLKDFYHFFLQFLA